MPYAKKLNRYLVRIDTQSMGHLFTDCLIVGGGVAGLRAALSAAEAGRVLILAKGKLPEDSNTYHAQGGIAAVMREDDDFESHIEDTLTTGCGLCNREVVELVVKNIPEHIRQLARWGIGFDMAGGQLDAGREGGHHKARIVHAMGDATGKALELCLWKQVNKHPHIKVFEECFTIDLLTREGRCGGVICYHPHYGFQCIWSRQTILATGGAGQLWRETTNPAGATADGLALAYRAGAVLTDLEFMQFHPTTIYIAGADRTLITEALRGEGAKLIDAKGVRFMKEYHEMAELAPRDIVSRAIYDWIAKTGATNVFLDIRHKGKKWLAERFPTISALCESFGIDVDEELIPVRPSAHYMIGGVKTDIHGRTNIENLYCCGEAACTGLHGSNRLASNSLSEGLIFGQACGQAAGQEITRQAGENVEHYTVKYDIPDSQRTRLDIADVTNSLRAIMWRNVGIQRYEERLDETIEIIEFWKRYVMDKVFDNPVDWQCQNMLTICRLIAASAMKRRESRGVHYRNDYPQQDDKHFLQHIDVKLGDKQ